MSKLSNRLTRSLNNHENLVPETWMNGTENIKGFGFLKDDYLFNYDSTINAEILQVFLFREGVLNYV